VIGVATGLATIAGGLLALVLRRRINLVLGFSAGAVVGVALLELLPEALQTGSKSLGVASILAIAGFGFMAYLAIDRILVAATGLASQGHLGAGSLTAHSFLEGWQSDWRTKRRRQSALWSPQQ
jgi:hypothetical protein